MLSVMIVDDEPLARAELRELLAEQAQLHIVAECANAVEAMSAINQHQPDIVFLDIQMPRISGLEMVSMLDKTACRTSCLSPPSMTTPCRPLKSKPSITCSSPLIRRGYKNLAAPVSGQRAATARLT